MYMEKFSNVRKIAVLKATALGDYIASTPALQALRETYPNAEIVLLGRPFHEELLKGRPGPVDRVIVIPISHGVRVEPSDPHLPEDKAELAAFFERMQREHFDLAVQLHGGGRNSNPFILKLGARHTVGLKTPEAPELERSMPYHFYHSEIMRLLEVVKLAGAKPSSHDPFIAVTERDLSELRRKLPHLKPPFAVLHPGASTTRRRWYPDRFARVGDALAEKGLGVVITGVDYEREVIDNVIRQMKYPAVNACERLSLGGLIALMSHASIVISNDTGPMHVAQAVGTPNVGIFWCGNYFNWSHYDRTRHRPLMSWTTSCPLCGADMTVMDPSTEFCDHDICFVDRVTVDEVLYEAFDLLDYAQKYGKKQPHPLVDIQLEPHYVE
jgi:ADP-heptose:LPS heptosyltransferase